MTNYIVIAVLVVVVALAVRSAAGHFRGEGGCCGGGTEKVRPKKLRAVTERKTFRIEGMHCQNCVNRVMEAVNEIDGVSGVVHLKQGAAVVSKERPVDDAVIREAIERAGYRVTEIR